MSSWTQEVTAFYKEQKKNNPNYKFKDALKELSRKRKGNASTPKKTHKKSHKKARKSKRSRK